MIRTFSAIILWWTLVPGESFLFPLLFPVQIKITFTARKPPPLISSYHFETAAPVYKEIVVKQTAHPQKQSYGDGHHQFSSYGDGHVKVYHEEPHVKSHKYSSGYGTPVEYPKPIYTKSKKTHVGTAYDAESYPEVSHPPVAPPSTYEDISEEHKQKYYPQSYLPQEQVKYGSGYHHHQPQYNGKYIEEYPPTYYDHEDSRYAQQYEDSTEIRSTQYKDDEPLLYAGFGSTVYGDSYAKIIYKPKPIKVSISAYSH